MPGGDLDRRMEVEGLAWLWLGGPEGLGHGIYRGEVVGRVVALGSAAPV